MFEMIFWGSIVVIGPFVYAALGGQPGTKEVKKSSNTSNNYSKDTYDYFNKLPLEEQQRYYKENLDLKHYKDDVTVGVTEDKQINAKHAAEISKRTCKKFIDRNKVY